VKETVGDPGIVLPIFKEGEGTMLIPDISSIAMTKASHQDPFSPVENYVETANTLDDLLELTPSHMFACPCLDLMRDMCRSHICDCLMRSPSLERVTLGQYNLILFPHCPSHYRISMCTRRSIPTPDYFVPLKDLQH
jgi:hypothetical protein